MPCSKHHIPADIAIYSHLRLYHIFAGLGSRMRARVVHRLLVVGAQYISFEAANLQLVYKQAGMPGPRPMPDSPLAGMDAICLDVRKISLEPQGMQTNPLQISPCACDSSRRKACLHLLRRSCHLSAEAPKVQSFQSNAPYGTATEQQADLEERVKPAETLCWRALCIPGWMWHKVAVNEPVSSKLQLAGVCISLRQYPHAPQPPPATSNAQASRSTEPEVHPGGIVAGTDLQQAGKGFVPNHAQPFAQETLSPGINSLPAPSQQPSAAFVTHTLLRQWGVEALVTIVPVGWTKEGEESAAVPSRVIAPGQPWKLQTRGLAKLNSIWESHEGDADDVTPNSPSVKPLFHSRADGHQTFGHENGSPGLLFTNRQTNPLCTPFLTFLFRES